MYPGPMKMNKGLLETRPHFSERKQLFKKMQHSLPLSRFGAGIPEVKKTTNFTKLPKTQKNQN